MVTIEHSRDGRIVTVTLNRPERRNALDQSLVGELTRVIRSLGQDDYARVIILTGAGNVFSAGADLDALQRLSGATDEENLADSMALANLFLTIRTCPKVVVANVNGHAIAGGSGLATACDMSIASRSAKFGFTEVRIGFVPALVSVLLQHRLRETDMRDLLLTGRLIPAEEAERIGLITKAVPEEQLSSAVWELAESIARNTSPEAIARTKALLATNEAADLGRAFENAAAANASARKTNDCLAGVGAFLEKDVAPWIKAWDADNGDSA